MLRRQTRQVMVGNVPVGGHAPITVQSMTNTDTRDVEATVDQILRLEEAGCEIIRVAVPDMEAAKKLSQIKSQIHIPLVADIHFDYKLALEAVRQGVDKLRINPGNIGDKSRVMEVVEAAKSAGIPIRIGVNGGSLEKRLIEKYGKVCAPALVESAMEHIKQLEALGFYDIIVALKSSDIELTLEAYKMLADEVTYPFHIGITESGTKFRGTIKSSIGVGALLLNGLGDTLRISLTGDPVEEVKVGREILSSMGIREFGIRLISCPTCGRCQVNLDKIASEVEKRIENIDKSLTLAVMGCAVNGPGEAREADIGIASGRGEALIFIKGEIVRKVKEEEIVDALMEEIEKM
ncbi:flavodoxin-dependent (E)-4-hydroxy-3-methylbut-2-enyl-diphosphate synthase [Fusibacter sp. JL216-2]|uniref:flavodoxin-dependent (E)-4-hydroxy-3-methylbut-2-enyl-diphosphate synthase n=1 Tax=Fusibacter sp. JL216-2 TaxID=3071453 RepID=UPI003D340B35